MDRCKELEIKIQKYAEAYYSGHQEITDDQFDGLVENLRKINPNSPILSSIGWGAKEFITRFKANHLGTIPVTGLSKVKYPSNVKYGYSVITPKIDGGSVCIYYKNSIPFAMITRGDGHSGLSIFHKFPDKFPHIPNKGIVCVRGEAYIPIHNFDELKKRGIPSPRNYATGILNRDSGSEDPDLKYINFLFYQIRICDFKLKTKIDELNYLKNCGFPTVPFDISENTSPDFLKNLYEEYQKNDFPIDGVVLSVMDIKKKDDEIIENSIAYKFESESMESTVTNIIWTTGSSGRVNPVIEFNPIFLSGALIQRATGMNAKFIKDFNIGIGSVVKITRSNEVIPYIQKVITPSNPILPDKCPSCGSKLKFDGTFLYCNNKKCPAQIRSTFFKILKVFGIPEGLGETNIWNFIELSKANDLNSFIEFILNVDNKTIDNNFAGHFKELINKLINNFRNKKSITNQEFWFMVGLNGISWLNAKKLPVVEEYISTPAKFTLTPSINSTLKSNFNLLVSVFNTLKNNNIFIKDIIINNNLIKVCYTGKTDKFKTRKDFFNNYSNKIIESPIQSCEYLICNNPSKSYKYKYAISHNIPIMTEEDFTKNILK